jgi:hypothetical protein
MRKKKKRREREARAIAPNDRLRHGYYPGMVFGVVACCRLRLAKDDDDHHRESRASGERL